MNTIVTEVEQLQFFEERREQLDSLLTLNPRVTRAVLAHVEHLQVGRVLYGQRDVSFLEPAPRRALQPQAPVHAHDFKQRHPEHVEGLQVPYQGEQGFCLFALVGRIVDNN